MMSCWSLYAAEKGEKWRERERERERERGGGVLLLIPAGVSLVGVVFVSILWQCELVAC